MNILGMAAAKLTHVSRTEIPNGTPTPIPANPDRLSVNLSIPLEAGVSGVIAGTQEDATLLSGFVGAVVNWDLVGVMIGTVDLTVDYSRFGSVVQQELWVRHTSGQGIVTEVKAGPELADCINLIADWIANLKPEVSRWRAQPPKPSDPLALLKHYLSQSQSTRRQ